MAYQAQVISARDNNQPVDLLPERTDMTADEVRELIFDTPTEVVVEQTNIELAAEIDEHPSMGFDELVDAINAELDAKTKRRSKKAMKEE